MKILLIRHAESEANAGLRTSDPAAISLTEKGIVQAIKLAEQFSEAPDLIITTTYLRTRQTAQPLIDKFPSVPVEVWPLHEFTFLSPSMCQNTTAMKRVPMVKEYWDRCDPFFVHGEGAESFDQFSTRVKVAWEKLKVLRHSSITIFTHGQVMRFLKQYLEEGDLHIGDAMQHLEKNKLTRPIQNAEIIVFQKI